MYIAFSIVFVLLLIYLINNYNSKPNIKSFERKIDFNENFIDTKDNYNHYEYDVVRGPIGYWETVPNHDAKHMESHGYSLGKVDSDRDCATKCKFSYPEKCATWSFNKKTNDCHGMNGYRSMIYDPQYTMGRMIV